MAVQKTKILGYALSVLLCATYLSSPTEARNANENNTQWDVKPFVSEDSSFPPYCALSRRYETEIIAIAKNNQGLSTIAIESTQSILKNLGKSSLYVALKTNNSSKIVSATPLTKSAMLIKLSKEDKINKFLKDASSLNVSSEGFKKTLSFNTDGISEAVKNLDLCLSKLPSKIQVSKIKTPVIEAHKPLEVLPIANVQTTTPTDMQMAIAEKDKKIQELQKTLSLQKKQIETSNLYENAQQSDGFKNLNIANLDLEIMKKQEDLTRQETYISKQQEWLEKEHLRINKRQKIVKTLGVLPVKLGIPMPKIELSKETFPIELKETKPLKLNKALPIQDVATMDSIPPQELAKITGIAEIKAMPTEDFIQMVEPVYLEPETNQGLNITNYSPAEYTDEYKPSTESIRDLSLHVSKYSENNGVVKPDAVKIKNIKINKKLTNVEPLNITWVDNTTEEVISDKAIVAEVTTTPITTPPVIVSTINETVLAQTSDDLFSIPKHVPVNKKKNITARIVENTAEIKPIKTAEIIEKPSFTSVSIQDLSPNFFEENTKIGKKKEVVIAVEEPKTVSIKWEEPTKQKNIELAEINTLPKVLPEVIEQVPRKHIEIDFVEPEIQISTQIASSEKTNIEENFNQIEPASSNTYADLPTTVVQAIAEEEASYSSLLDSVMNVHRGMRAPTPILAPETLMPNMTEKSFSTIPEEQTNLRYEDLVPQNITNTVSDNPIPSYAQTNLDNIVDNVVIEKEEYRTVSKLSNNYEPTEPVTSSVVTLSQIINLAGIDIQKQRSSRKKNKVQEWSNAYMNGIAEKHKWSKTSKMSFHDLKGKYLDRYKHDCHNKIQTLLQYKSSQYIETIHMRCAEPNNLYSASFVFYGIPGKSFTTFVHVASIENEKQVQDASYNIANAIQQFDGQDIYLNKPSDDSIQTASLSVATDEAPQQQEPVALVEPHVQMTPVEEPYEGYNSPIIIE